MAVELPDHDSSKEEDIVKAESMAEESSLERSIPRPETPSTSHPASEENSTNPTTPSSQQLSTPVPGETTPVAPKPAQKAVPVIPALPKIAQVAKSAPTKEKSEQKSEGGAEVVPEVEATSGHVDKDAANTEVKEEGKEATPGPAAWSKPKLWAGLFNPGAVTSVAAPSESGQATTSSFGKTNAESLAEALRSFNATSTESKVAFLEPRGLVNTGNMCYMNSVSLTSCVMSVHC